MPRRLARYGRGPAATAARTAPATTTSATSIATTPDPVTQQLGALEPLLLRVEQALHVLVPASASTSAPAKRGGSDSPYRPAIPQAGITVESVLTTLQDTLQTRVLPQVERAATKKDVHAIEWDTLLQLQQTLVTIADQLRAAAAPYTLALGASDPLMRQLDRLQARLQVVNDKLATIRRQQQETRRLRIQQQPAPQVSVRPQTAAATAAGGWDYETQSYRGPRGGRYYIHALSGRKVYLRR